MRSTVAVAPPETRRGKPARTSLKIASSIINGQQDTPDQDTKATAALFLARRHFVRLPIALIIAAEIGLGGRS
jgi:hypothetical protein